MKINFSRELFDEAGAPINIGTEKEPKPGTLGWIACQALLSTFQQESATGEDKHNRFKIWQRIKDGGECELTVEEVSLVKRLIGYGAAPLICGQAWEILEGA